MNQNLISKNKVGETRRKMMEQKIAVLGAGSWGTALAVTLAGKNHTVCVWDVDLAHLKALSEDRENRKYLPEVLFPEKITISADIEAVMNGADIVLFSAPAQHFRSAFASAIPYLKENMIIVNVAKGIEQKSLMRLSEIAFEQLPSVKICRFIRSFPCGRSRKRSADYGRCRIQRQEPCGICAGYLHDREIPGLYRFRYRRC